MTQPKPLILIIDDEEAILKTLKDALIDESYRVETLNGGVYPTCGTKALDIIGKLIPDLVLLDIFMPNCNGLALLTQIKKEYPQQKVIIISGFGTIPIAIEAIQKGAIDFIEKPLNLDEILNKIEFLKKPVVEKEEQATANTDLLKACNITGESNLFLELVQQIDRLAPHRFPIIIYGEYGTGKTTLANYLYKKSTSPETLETIDCETISQGDGGTVFEKTFSGNKTVYLKRIDTLDRNEQKTALSVLQKHPDVRVIASSIQSLFTLMQKKLFNSSLFATLNKAPLEVPPLRKRPYDIPLLVDHYLKTFNKSYKKQVILNTQSVRLLRNHKWPGNINELRQVIENIVIHAPKDHTVITPQSLAPILGEKDMQFIEEQSLFQFDSIDQATDEFKRSFLLYLLRKNHYNVEQVSGRLNLTPLQLKNQLLELKISLPG